MNCTKYFVCRRDDGKPVPAQLHELGQAREMTQIAVGAALNVEQPAVAMLERRADMYVSNLRAYVEAVGGKLHIVAEFPHGNVKIANFTEIGNNGS